MAEFLEESQSLESTTVGIYRTATVVKGGRRFSFGALVVVGDRRGKVGIGYGKAPGVPGAIEKAQKDARKKMIGVSLQEGTLPHPVKGKFGASSVQLLPAAPGTGVIAGGTVRAVLEMAGVRDCLTKAFGSTNQKNLCKAAMQGLESIRLKAQIAALRGVELDTTETEKKLELGRRFAPQVSGAPRMKAFNVREPAGGKRGGGGRGRGGGGGGGGRGRREQAAPQAQPAAATATETPAPEAPTQE